MKRFTQRAHQTSDDLIVVNAVYSSICRTTIQGYLVPNFSISLVFVFKFKKKEKGRYVCIMS